MGTIAKQIEEITTRTMPFVFLENINPITKLDFAHKSFFRSYVSRFVLVGAVALSFRVLAIRTLGRVAVTAGGWAFYQIGASL